VTFIDQSDTTKKFTTITDTLGNYHVSVLTAVDDKKFVLPSTVELAQNYPNPFSSSTAISYKLNKQSDAQVTIFDMLGREVKRYSVGLQTVGAHGVVWDGKNNVGQRVATGVYFYRLQAKGETQVKKMVFVGGTATISVPLIGSFSSDIKDFKKESMLQITGGTFTVQIKNTDSTQPRIIEITQNDVEISSDTTIDFHLQETLSKDANIRDIAFVDSLCGWLVTGLPGGIFKTEDGGNTWFGQKTDAYNFSSLFVKGRDSIWATGDTTIFFSTNGGLSWQRQNNPTTFSLAEVFFVNDSEGWAVGGRVPVLGQKSNVILHTINAGLNWEISYSSDEGSLMGVHFIGSHGWAVGNTSFDNFGVPLILHTTDFGQTWVRQHTPSSIQAPVQKVQFWDQSLGYAVGYAGVLKTSDGGTNWVMIQDYMHSKPPLVNLALMSETELWVNSGIDILRSTDGGENWTEEWQRNENNTYAISSIFFLNNAFGWAVGSKNTIMKYENGGWTILPH
jgi:photosystem II stability/assembly factor-like uncharacterized protein